MRSDFDVVIVGAGAAGLAAADRLAGSGLDVVAVEARERIGGRAETIDLASPADPAAVFPVDRGCGWLHSADINPLVPLIEAAGFALDHTPAAWQREAEERHFPIAEQRRFAEAVEAFEARVEAAVGAGIDRPAADLFEPGNRWNPLIDAVSSYHNGAEFDQVSILDYSTYHDTEVNYRVRDGYGAAIARLGSSADVIFRCPVRTIDHGGRTVRIETARGTLNARAVIVTVPTPHLAEARIRLMPALPAKVEAAGHLPLGLANKAFIGLLRPEAFAEGSRFLGDIGRTATASYHVRPFGRPYIEAYAGGRNARALEAEGEGALTAFALDELKGLLGAEALKGFVPLGETAWASDPHARGGYSYALPMQSGARARLAEPTDGRLFWGGEATHPTAFSTAHGAWASGRRAAEEALAALA